MCRFFIAINSITNQTIAHLSSGRRGHGCKQSRCGTSTRGRRRANNRATQASEAADTEEEALMARPSSHFPPRPPHPCLSCLAMAIINGVPSPERSLIRNAELSRRVVVSRVASFGSMHQPYHTTQQN